jgi:hypothetical protein
MLDFDVPSDAGSASISIPGVENPRLSTDLLATGSGVVVAPSIVLTSRKVIETSDYAGPKLITVGRYDGSEFNTQLVRHVMTTASRAEATRSVSFGAANPRGPARSTVGWTEFRYTHPDEGGVDAEIAALHVPGIDKPPVVIAEAPAKPGTKCELLGFVRGRELVRRGVQRNAGRVESPAAIGGRGLQTISAAVRGGNRGGPVVDENRRVIGIAFDNRPDGKLNGGLMQSANTVRAWFYKHVQTASLRDSADESTSKSGVQDSVVPIFVWGQRKTQTTLFSEMADSGSSGESFVIRDRWCIACQGTSVLGCPNPRCARGTVTKKQRVLLNRDPLSGNLYGTRSVRAECPTCDGAGGKRCPFCKGGRL